MTALSHHPMLISADFMGQHPASHDDFLARRHAQRSPRVKSLEAKLTSSFFPTVDRAPIDPPSASHDEFLARRHAERTPRATSLEAKLTSSFLIDPPSASHDEFLAHRHAERAPRVSLLEVKLTSSLDDYECVVHPPEDATSIESSAPTSPPPSASPVSRDEFIARHYIHRFTRCISAPLSSARAPCSFIRRGSSGSVMQISKH